jgi:hypothetical protein
MEGPLRLSLASALYHQYSSDRPKLYRLPEIWLSMTYSLISAANTISAMPPEKNVMASNPRK